MSAEEEDDDPVLDEPLCQSLHLLEAFDFHSVHVLVADAELVLVELERGV